METGFFKDPGLSILTLVLIIVTGLYAWATIKMWRVMKNEYELKTKPRFGFSPYIIQCIDWTRITVSQEVTNIGISYSVIEKAKLFWKPKNKAEIQTTFSKEGTPLIIASGEKISFTFEINEETLKLFKNNDVSIPTNLISGDIIYQCKGLDNKEIDFQEPILFEQYV